MTMTSLVNLVMRAVKRPVIMPIASPPRAIVKKEVTPRRQSDSPTWQSLLRVLILMLILMIPIMILILILKLMINIILKM